MSQKFAKLFKRSSRLAAARRDMLATGAPILNLRDVVHGGFKVVGPGNVILFTVHTVDKGKPLYDWVK